MKQPFLILYCLTLFLLVFAADRSYGFPVADIQEEERNRAIELFHSVKFNEALPIFKKLSDSYPSDYLLKYFTGASMIETGNYTKETEMNLLLAGTREVPAKVFYYLARYYHARGDWDSAVRFYNRYRNNAQHADIAALRIEELVQLAYSHTNPYQGSEIMIPESAAPVPVQSENTLPVTAEPAATLPADAVEQPESSVPEPTLAVTEPDVAVEIKEGTDSLDLTNEEELISEGDTLDLAIPSVTGPEKVREPVRQPELPRISFIHFQVNPQVTYLTEDLFQVAEARDAWKQGNARQSELNNLIGTLSKLREQYPQTVNPAERDQLANQIISLERESLTLRGESEQLIQKARSLEQTWWADADFDTYSKFRQVTDSLLRLQEAVRQAALPPPPVIDESLITGESDEEEEDDDGEAGPETVIYMVQLGSFKGKLPVRTQALFDKISRIRTIDTFENEDGTTVYTTGNMRTFADGLTLQNQIRLEGVKDAFVIAIQDGKRIPLPDAKRLTGEE
jgi:tetratricopeptide (TPR) repeat protein